MNQTTMATPKGPETFTVGNRRTTTTEPPASRAALVTMPFDSGRALVNGGIETHSDPTVPQSPPRATARATARGPNRPAQAALGIHCTAPGNRGRKVVAASVRSFKRPRTFKRPPACSMYNYIPSKARKRGPQNCPCP